LINPGGERIDEQLIDRYKLLTALPKPKRVNCFRVTELPNMSKVHLRIALALLVGLVFVPTSLTNFAGSRGVVLAQDSATSPSAQASRVVPPGMVPNIDHPLGPIELWVKGHALEMPYPECANLIERTMWGQNIVITDAPCRAKLEEALRINRTEPDIESGPPLLNGPRPEDLRPRDAHTDPAPDAEATQ